MTVAVVASDHDHAAAAREVAQVWSSALDLTAHYLPPIDHIDVEAVLDALSGEGVAMAIVSAAGDPSDPCWTVAGRAEKPVLLVPRRYATGRSRLRTALLPLDGSADSAAAAVGVAKMLASCGVALVLLHVFDAATVPRYWDQGVHAQEAWEAEFLARYGAAAPTRLTLRAGRPGEHVPAVARENDADVIALVWSRHLDSGRAATVRQTVSDSDVPVLLTPWEPVAMGRKSLGRRQAAT